MAKTGYLFLAKGYHAREEDVAWMKDYGCDSIIVEEGIKERLRPQWRKLLTLVRPGDELILTKLSNREIQCILSYTVGEISMFCYKRIFFKTIICGIIKGISKSYNSEPVKRADRFLFNHMGGLLFDYMAGRNLPDYTGRRKLPGRKTLPARQFCSFL